MTRKFKTNLKCGGCVATITPHLDAEASIESWEVDLESKDKVLLVKGKQIDSARVIELMREAGFEAREQRGIFGKAFG